MSEAREPDRFQCLYNIFTRGCFGSPCEVDFLPPYDYIVHQNLFNPIGLGWKGGTDGYVAPRFFLDWWLTPVTHLNMELLH